MLGSISLEAQQKLAELRTFNGSRKTFDEEETPPKVRGEQRWEMGRNTNSKSRSFRVLMPLSYFVDIMRKADTQWFVDKGGVACHWKDLANPDVPLFIITTAELKPLKWHDIGGPYVELKTIELALNFMEDMTRFQLNQPTMPNLNREDKQDLIARFFSLWEASPTCCFPFFR